MGRDRRMIAIERKQKSILNNHSTTVKHDCQSPSKIVNRKIYLELLKQFIFTHSINFIPRVPWPLEISSQNYSDFTATCSVIEPEILK